MRITDFHTHAFPDDLAPHAMTRLGEHADAEKAFLDGTVSDLLRSMDAAGICRSVLCSVATAPRQFDPILAFSDRVRSDRIVPFPSFHPDSPDLVALVRRTAAEAFLGVKLHPCYQGFAPDEDRLLPMYEAAADAGLIIVFHAGWDFAFPEDWMSRPERIAKVARRFPHLLIVAAHMGGYRRWEDSLAHLAGLPNVYFETSFSLDELPRSLLDALIARKGDRRILFGTDSPWRDQADSLRILRALDLPPVTLSRLLEANASDLLDGCPSREKSAPRAP